MKITKDICKEMRKKGTWKRVLCALCTFRKKCPELDYQENHE